MIREDRVGITGKKIRPAQAGWKTDTGNPGTTAPARMAAVENEP